MRQWLPVGYCSSKCQILSLKTSTVQRSSTALRSLFVDHHRNSVVMHFPCTLAFCSPFQLPLNKFLPTRSQLASVKSGFISNPLYLQSTDTDISICLLLGDSLLHSSSQFMVLLIALRVQTLPCYKDQTKLCTYQIQSCCSTIIKGKMVQMNMTKCLIFPLQQFLEFNLTFSIFLFPISLSYKWPEYHLLFTSPFFFFWQENPLPMRTFYLNHRKCLQCNCI